jgi:hypothetical protein
MKRLFFFGFIWINTLDVYGGVERSKEDPFIVDIHQRWLNLIFELTKNTVGFSAPVSARAYCYVSVTMYESSFQACESLISLSQQLKGYQRHVWFNPDIVPHSVVTNAALHEIVPYLYRAMPPSQALHVNELYASIRKSCQKRYGKKNVDEAEAYGRSIANEIIEWSKQDGGDDGFQKNFPLDFVPPSCKGCWTKTFPGYLPAMLPNWGKNNTLLPNSHELVKPCTPDAYTSDSTGTLFLDAMEIVSTTASDNPNYENIAEYWNDATGYSGTPPGHLFMLSAQLFQNQKIPLKERIECYVKLGIALNEAFITCWKLKYEYNLLRPISFIHQHIDPYFNSKIDSPPFPEFPSGHSFQSGAGTSVLKHLLGNDFPFTDSTNLYRNDIVNTPRSFANFDSLAQEISISRLYGGIHYRETLKRSLEAGKLLGLYVVKTIKCRKE